ncbi:hydrophobe/amphiphile efflux-1 (HAE1) family protein [Chromohalobacter israelensis]|nr:hydrophobe/amphiphile efflux-1 (HAE1) family protein [Chromohalobacter salexigens]
MNFSRFFVDRPIFAAVLSIVIFAVGAISIPNLPVGEYPEVVPPSVLVRTTYPGANPKEIAETVATPLEEAITGVEDMMYFKSVAGSDGVLQMTITFQPGTDAEQATVRVQNRVSQALARLPEAVRRQGVTTQKQSPTFLMVVHLVSPDDSYDTLYLRNYARLHVRDQLAKISGVGEAQLFGGGDYAMRTWLDPDRIASHGLTAGDVVDAMREQNVQVSAGQIGAEPMPDSDFLTLINAKGRLSTEQEFGNIVLKVGEDGEILRLGDVARLEMGAGDYTLRSRLDGKEAVAIGIFQSPGANALQIRDQVVRTMDELATRFPPGVEYRTVYDTTLFVSDSIRSVIQTLLEAILLVVLVVTLFLQTWRASLIPLLAVPVSVVGTFAVLLLLGYSINTLTLFGLVLAIGIVVDDAIVVVENVERNIGQGLAPRAAAHQAMREVSGPIVAIGLVLCAVFVPMAFLSGVTGQFYRQFAVTIAISTVISTINSLTLSPALAAMLLRPHDAPKDRLTRVIDVLFGWLFRPFNRFFNASSRRYQGVVSRSLRRRGAVFVVYLVLLGATGYLLKIVPPGFIPVQDKMYLIAGVKLPKGASLDRTDDLLRQVVDIAMKTDGVEHAISFPGLNALQFTRKNGQRLFCR